MSVLICSACLGNIVSKLVKDSCIILISLCSCVLFVVIVGVPIVFLVAWAYVIPVVLQFSVVLQGFHFLVQVYLQYEYLLLFVEKKFLCLRSLGRLCSLVS
jgi:hypothetical protein